MKIGFTGHRDRVADEAIFAQLAADYPEAVWVHGGAVGFDAQAAAYARRHGIATQVYFPQYQLYGLKAPLMRNEQIVEDVSLLVALWDGRETGGTYYTVQYAQQRGMRVIMAKIARATREYERCP